MKKLLCAFAVLVSCNTYAECLLDTTLDDELSDQLRVKGWNFANYDELCQKLEKANAGVQIDQVSMITEYQTTVATSVRLFPLELQKKHNQRFLTQRGFIAVATNPERTSVAQKNLKYINANYALNGIVTDGGLPEMLKNLATIRKTMKP